MITKGLFSQYSKRPHIAFTSSPTPCRAFTVICQEGFHDQNGASKWMTDGLVSQMLGSGVVVYGLGTDGQALNYSGNWKWCCWALLHRAREGADCCGVKGVMGPSYGHSATPGGEC